QYEKLRRSDPAAGLACDGIPREHHPAGLDAKRLAVLPAGDDAPAVAGLAAKDGRLLPVGGVRELRLEPSLLPPEDHLVAFHEPDAKERCNLVGRGLVDTPRARRHRPAV